MEYLFGLILCLIAVVARVAITRVASASAVDQHYWALAAKAYREQRGLPVRISGKYLMEEEDQAYPPLFGILLGRVFNAASVKYATPAIEFAELLLLAAVMTVLGLPASGVVIAIGFYLCAPILVVYNAQLTPRILGDFFLFAAMACQVIANYGDFSSTVQLCLWVGSALMLAAMFMTHKMTYQLHLVMLPFWAWVLQSWLVPLVTAGGLLLYLLLVGYRFALLQARAHIDIVTFWNRNWRNLGAHQFLNSPIYGREEQSRDACFHAPELRGVIKHIRVVVSYAPIVIVLPICGLLSDSLPPNWVLVWLGVTYLWVFLTLFFPPLKCFGGGHLYVFNAVIPCSLFAAYLPQTPTVQACLIAAAMLTMVSLFFAWRTVKARPISRATDFDEALTYLKALPTSRVAVFPLQAAEPVAAQTGHAVLWGGHGLGFNRLEGFYPVVSKRLGGILKNYLIDWVLWDSSYWWNGLLVLKDEQCLDDVGSVRSFGRWRLVRLTPSSD